MGVPIDKTKHFWLATRLSLVLLGSPTQGPTYMIDISTLHELYIVPYNCHFSGMVRDTTYYPQVKVGGQKVKDSNLCGGYPYKKECGFTVRIS